MQGTSSKIRGEPSEQVPKGGSDSSTQGQKSSSICCINERKGAEWQQNWPLSQNEKQNGSRISFILQHTAKCEENQAKSSKIKQNQAKSSKIKQHARNIKRKILKHLQKIEKSANVYENSAQNYKHLYFFQKAMKMLKNRQNNTNKFQISWNSWTP